ncbi:quinone oxidoreductase [Calidifontibacter sp. DB0510]|uniref:Quinone oxidoreductase n=1 Tax=Metallococcus carri TaxID=1656884 RepID=A0A967AYF6_9MICO|nr:quinone oxidoreductase [Metallococcus carri]NHN54729.1 quinone oxidoreductase [Metallococcus carri]NOP37074.1 quinone oxidoreductase [Calidifontibacter sp. DB2511S]
MTRSLIVTEPGDRDVLAVQDAPVLPPAPGEVQVQVAAVGVNFIDVYKRQGIYPQDTPFVLGEEAAGTVVGVGRDVQDFAEGDRVAWAQSAGSAAALVNVPAERAVRVPDGVDLDTAAAVMLQGMTAHYLVTSTWPIEPGQIALVHAAAGGVGQLLVQLITARGASVVATAGTDEKLQIAKDLGAAHVINYRQYDGRPDELAATVRALAGRGVDVAYDGVGKATFEASLKSLRPRGLLALFGGASGQVPPFDLQLLNKYGSLFITRPTLAHYLGDRAELEWRAREILDAVADGSLKVDIGARFPLEQAADAYAALEGRRTTGKVLLTL